MNETTKTTPHCCYLNCDMPAKWRIRDGNSPDGYTDACSQHIADLMQPGKVSAVWPLTGTVDVGGMKCSQSCVEAGIERQKAMQLGIRDLRRSFDEHWSGKTVEEVWEEFWKDIVCKNGRLDREQIKKELYDYKTLMRNATRVYCHITGDTISKPLTDPISVCQLADEHYMSMYTQEEDVTNSVDVTGLFQHLLNILQTILITTTDERTKSFILAEVEARELVPKDALNTFEILADLPADLGLTVEQQVCTMRATVCLTESMACIDDARQLTGGGSHLSVVLSVLHDFMDGLTSQQIKSWEDAN